MQVSVQTMYADLVDRAWSSPFQKLFQTDGSPYKRTIAGKDYCNRPIAAAFCGVLPIYTTSIPTSLLSSYRSAFGWFLRIYCGLSAGVGGRMTRSLLSSETVKITMFKIHASCSDHAEMREK